MNIHQNIKRKIIKLKENNIDTSLSSLCHLSSSRSVIGYFYLKLLLKQFKIINLYNVLKFIISIGYQKKFKLINRAKGTYKFIFITWAFKNNFNKDGSLSDRYFSINSNYKKKDILWYVIYMDKFLPEKINNNIVVFKTEKNFSLGYLIFIFVESLIKKKLNFKKVLHEIFSASNFTKIFLTEFKNQINFVKIKKIMHLMKSTFSKPFIQLY